MRVICVKWGDKYGPEYVLRLRNMVAKHLPFDHEFVCITEKPVDGITCVPFEADLPGWWSKIEMFKPDRFHGDNLYFDLDVVIGADISRFVMSHQVIKTAEAASLWALDDFSYSLRKPRQGLSTDMLATLGGLGTCNSSVMFWNGNDARAVWDKFDPRCMTTLHGDQNWISKCMWPFRLALFPDGLACSYKYHVMRGEKPAPICVFHGAPKPHDLPRSNPLRQLWEAA